MEQRNNASFLADLKEWNLELSDTQLFQLEKYLADFPENMLKNIKQIAPYMKNYLLLCVVLL